MRHQERTEQEKTLFALQVYNYVESCCDGTHPCFTFPALEGLHKKWGKNKTDVAVKIRIAERRKEMYDSRRDNQDADKWRKGIMAQVDKCKESIADLKSARDNLEDRPLFDAEHVGLEITVWGGGKKSISDVHDILSAATNPDERLIWLREGCFFKLKEL